MILVTQHYPPVAQTAWQRMSSVQLMYIAQTWALRRELKQNRYPEKRNAGNMTEFFVNRPVVVLVENHTQTLIGSHTWPAQLLILSG